MKITILLPALIGVSLLSTLLFRLPEGSIAAGVTIGPFSMGSLSEQEAAELLNRRAAFLEGWGLPLVFNNQTVEFKSTIGDPANLELASPVFHYQVEEALKNALKIGRSGSLMEQWLERASARFFGERLSLPFALDENLARQFLKDNFGRFETAPRDAGFLVVFGNSSKDKFEVQVLPESPGSIFYYEEAIGQIKERLANFDLSPIVLRIIEQPAAVTQADANALKGLFESILNRGDITLLYENKKFLIKTRAWTKWVYLVKDSMAAAHLELSHEAIAQGLREAAGEVEVEEQPQKMVLVDSKIKEFQPPRTGIKIDDREMYERLKRILFGDSSAGREAVLAVKRTEPPAAQGTSEELGLGDLLGVGRTSFKGSPTNRRLNIKQGTATLNGMLIPPGEVFSTIQALGEIDEEHGYRSELVIKKDKTTPEFGGGLCQVSTTLFRSVLSAGLPVVERQNHSYRVRYYEPAGVDATIYSPRPDFKFKNDTGRYILIQSRIEGDEAVFELWGTKDGRLAEATKPLIFNIVPPPEPKLIETAELPPGKKNCTEQPHDGADTIFSYTIKYPDGTVKKEDFKSRYKPWGEVCLIGVTATSTSPLFSDLPWSP